jgi:hypothetical protein
MKFIAPNPIDDDSTLRLLSENKALASYNELSLNLQAILDAYQVYRDVRGNGSHITAIPLSKTLKANLNAHYNSPPTTLQPILNQIRTAYGTNVCSMCGGYGVGTLDHIIPKTPFPEFSILTLNLVPACPNCNSFRSTNYANSTGGRVLHPYYDEILRERLVRAAFRNSDSVSKTIVTLEIIYNGPLLDAVRYHFEHVVWRDFRQAEVQDIWSGILRKPRGIIPEIPQGIITIAQLKLALSAALSRFDDEFETPNNLRSMVISGAIENNDICNQLLVHINGLENETVQAEDI